MTFATVTNIATMLLCIAVLIQSVRLMRCLRAVKGGALTEVVTALDTATAQARIVLARLGDLLREDCAASARTLAEGKDMLDELTVVTGIANAIAERIVDAATAHSRAPADAAEADVG
jgi:hypothetical protein